MRKEGSRQNGAHIPPLSLRVHGTPPAQPINQYRGLKVEWRGEVEATCIGQEGKSYLLPLGVPPQAWPQSTLQAPAPVPPPRLYGHQALSLLMGHTGPSGPLGDSRLSQLPGPSNSPPHVLTILSLQVGSVLLGLQGWLTENGLWSSTGWGPE